MWTSPVRGACLRTEGRAVSLKPPLEKSTSETCPTGRITVLRCPQNTQWHVFLWTLRKQLTCEAEAASNSDKVNLNLKKKYIYFLQSFLCGDLQDKEEDGKRRQRDLGD